jgi:hypothetical protein
VLHVVVDPPIVAAEEDLDRIVEQTGLLEERSKRRACPLGTPYGLIVPRR